MNRPMLRRVPRRRLGGVLLIASLVAVPACVFAAAAHDELPSAHHAEGSATTAAPDASLLEAPKGFDPYIYRPTGELADPINVIFLHTDAATAAAAVERVLGWRPVVASSMTFKQRNGTRPTFRQLAADLGPGSRYHMRIQAVPITDTQTYVLASVHRDETAPCGHVGRGFDEMRDLVAERFTEAGFPARLEDLGNTTAGRHCDGSYVGGDGRAVLIDLSHVPRVDTITVRNGTLGAQ
ncbi:MAG: hypothetical protein ACRDJE_12910 [Dehalococcoidia bacterium]